MFKEPITEITFEKVEDFCKEELPEGIRWDYKEDFPKDLAKTIAAFANTHGGLILIGVEETDQGTPVLPIKGISLERGLVERVTAIAFRGIYPPVFPEIKICEFSAKGAGEPDRAVVVIRVQESSDTPHAIENKTKVYIRVERQNEPYELAQVDQIIALAARRKEAVENRHRMISNAFERCQNVRRAIIGSKPIIESPVAGPTITTIPYLTVSIAPLFPHGPLISLDDIYNMALKQSPHLSVGGITPVPGGIRFKSYEGGFNYMELNQQGLVFYSETLEEEIYIPEIVVGIGEAIKYALYYCYEKMRFWGFVKIEVSLSNILGKRLLQKPSWSWPGKNYVCYDSNIEREVTKSVSELKEDYLSVVEYFVKEFTWGFGLKLPDDHIKKLVESNLTKP